MRCEHKYRFGASGKPLKSFFGRKAFKERRIFPKYINDTREYVAAYFRLNSGFVEN